MSCLITMRLNDYHVQSDFVQISLPKIYIIFIIIYVRNNSYFDNKSILCLRIKNY